MNRFVSLSGFGLAFAASGCGAQSSRTADEDTGDSGAAGREVSGVAGQPAGAGGTGGPVAAGGGPGDSRGGSNGTGGGSAAGGLTGDPGGAGMGGEPAGGSAGLAGGGAAGSGQSGTAGTAGAAGSAGEGGSNEPPVDLPPLVTSGPDQYWKTDGTLTETTAEAIVTVEDALLEQTWEGFGGAFNELGWSYLTTSEMQAQAVKLLFSAADGANFAWGRVPIGASSYATSRYTLADTGDDLEPDAGESNRPPADPTLSTFSLARDSERIIPYIKAAQAVKPGLRFWASPWTPPVWMKTGYKTYGSSTADAAKRPSYYDGGSMRSDVTTLAAYAAYFQKFVEGYRAQGIAIELVSPQDEPGYEQNYPSCLWDKDTYARFIGDFLGPAMEPLGVTVMLGTFAQGDYGGDFELAQAALESSAAGAFLGVVGVQWGALNADRLAELGSTLPIWATEHKGGNYPFLIGYVAAAAPNDHAYGVESWGLIHDAVTRLRVTAYNAWNMVLDKVGWGLDTSREWAQDALLVADAGHVTPTPAYYVFRHLSQYAVPGARVVRTTGGEAIAFKNPDGSLVTVIYNGGAANDAYVIAIGGKKFQFAMPENGWATVKYEP